jgi:hypothetical protein
VKRLIVLLIVLAGGLAAAAFAVPSNAATGNGVSISQRQFSSDLNAIAGSPDYQCFLNAEEAVGSGGDATLPPVSGAGTHATVTTGFAANYLDTAIEHQLVLGVAATRHIRLTSQDLSSARAELTNQITGILSEVASSKYACGTAAGKDVLSSMPSSFVDRDVRFDATVSVLEETLAGVGPTTADLEGYYQTHSSLFDTACFTVAEFSSQAAAQTAAGTVAAGTPFATVAAAAQGGPQACEILYGVSASLPAGTDLQDLPLNTVSNPVAVNGSYLLIEITSRTPTSFTKAKSEVLSAVQGAGAPKVSTLISNAGKRATVSVDGRYGEWTPSKTQVLPPSAPLAVDLLNPSVDGSGT